MEKMPNKIGIVVYSGEFKVEAETRVLSFSPRFVWRSTPSAALGIQETKLSKDAAPPPW